MASFYLTDGPLSSLGKHHEVAATLRGDLPDLIGFVQGLLVYDHYGGVLYGDPPAYFYGQSRQTLPFEQRLDVLLTRDPRGLDQRRETFERAVGTRRHFVTAAEVWNVCREAGNPALFGKRDLTRRWFMAVNLAPDASALLKRETSARDGWWDTSHQTLTDEQEA